MTTSKAEPSRKDDWIQAAMRHNAFESLAELGRIATTIYLSAKGEGLSAAEAKDVTEATLGAMSRWANNAGSPEGE